MSKVHELISFAYRVTAFVSESDCLTMCVYYEGETPSDHMVNLSNPIARHVKRQLGLTTDYKYVIAWKPAPARGEEAR